MGIWGNPAATKKNFSTHLGGAPAPGAPPLPCLRHWRRDANGAKLIKAVRPGKAGFPSNATHATQ